MNSLKINFAIALLFSFFAFGCQEQDSPLDENNLAAFEASVDDLGQATQSIHLVLTDPQDELCQSLDLRADYQLTAFLPVDRAQDNEGKEIALVVFMAEHFELNQASLLMNEREGSFVLKFAEGYFSLPLSADMLDEIYKKECDGSSNSSSGLTGISSDPALASISLNDQSKPLVSGGSIGVKPAGTVFISPTDNPLDHLNGLSGSYSIIDSKGGALVEMNWKRLAPNAMHGVVRGQDKYGDIEVIEYYIYNENGKAIMFIEKDENSSVISTYAEVSHHQARFDFSEKDFNMNISLSLSEENVLTFSTYIQSHDGDERTHLKLQKM